MKLSFITKIIAAATLVSTTTIGMTAIQATSNSSAKLPANGQFLAKADTALAKQLQGKPTVVDVYATWCGGCKAIAPTLSQVKQQYGNKVNFIVFDVSDAKKSQASMKMAAKLGLTNFYEAHKSQTATVAVINPANGKIVKQFRANPEFSDYTTAIDLSISQIGSSNAMKKNGDAMGAGDAMKK